MIDLFLQYDGRILLLTLLGMITIVPVAVVIIKKSKSRFRYFGWVLALLFSPFALLSGHELFAHVIGSRPWSPLYDFWLSSFIPSFKKQIFADVAVPTNHVEVVISHTVRGKYVWSLVTSPRVPHMSRVIPEIRPKCKVYKLDGSYVCDLSEAGLGPMQRYRRSKVESEADCGYYRSPKQIPLDIPLKFVFDFEGDFDGFRRKYPRLRLVVRTICDW